MREEFKIKYIIFENEKEGDVQLHENEDDVNIVLKIENKIIAKQADNFFQALIDVRKELEKINIKLLCKGCCRNVYPSGMLLGMGNGRKAYQLTMSKQARLDSLVDIFETCNIEEYASVDEQYNFFNVWCDSIRRK